MLWGHHDLVNVAKGIISFYLIKNEDEHILINTNQMMHYYNTYDIYTLYGDLYNPKINIKYEPLQTKILLPLIIGFFYSKSLQSKEIEDFQKIVNNVSEEQDSDQFAISLLYLIYNKIIDTSVNIDMLFNKLFPEKILNKTLYNYDVSKDLDKMKKYISESKPSFTLQKYTSHYNNYMIDMFGKNVGGEIPNLILRIINAPYFNYTLHKLQYPNDPDISASISNTCENKPVVVHIGGGIHQNKFLNVSLIKNKKKKMHVAIS